MLEANFTGRFRRDYKSAIRRGLDISLLDGIIRDLVNEVPLPKSNNDHALTGNWKPRRECHVKADWLLIYQLDKEDGIIIFERTGTHSDLFG